MTQPVGIIFGGSKGIGAATAKSLAAKGVDIIVAARNLDECGKTAEEIQVSGARALALKADVTDRGQVDAVVQTAMDRFGRLDYIINSAGIMDPVGRTEECDPEAWATSLKINLLGSFHACHAALPVFRARNNGVMVNMSSGAAFHALEGWGAYCTAKAGLAMLTQILAAELAGTDICVYGFQPGMVNTGLTREALQHKVNRIADLDVETFDAPEAPAAALAWLCLRHPRDLSGREVVFTDPKIQKRLAEDMKIDTSECRV